MPLTTLPIEISTLIVEFLPSVNHQALTERLKYFLTTPPGVEALQVDLAVNGNVWEKSISFQRD